MWVALLAALLIACRDSGEDTTRVPPTDNLPSGDPSAQAARPFLAWQPAGWQNASRETVTYHEDGTTRLTMDLYSPAKPRATTPVVVVLHGVTPDADPKRFAGLVAWGQSLAARGITAAVINYRPTDRRLSATGVSDVSQAVSYLRENAAALGIDGERLGMLGFSAAGPYLTASAFQDANQPVRALAALYAPVEPAGQGVPGKVSLSEQLRTHPQASAFVAYGGQDTNADINASIRRFARSPVATSARVTLCRHPDGVHGFDFLNHDARSRRIIEGVLEFFASELEVAAESSGHQGAESAERLC